MDFFAFILLIFISSIVLSIVIWSWRYGISPMPSSFKAVRCILEAAPKDIKGTIIDLGSGWGSIVFPLAKRFPRCRVIGYETSPVPFYFTKLRNNFYSLKNLELYRKDFFKESLEEAELIVCYLYPGAMKILKTKLESELKPGTWVISNTFAIPGWQPFQVYQLDDIYKTKIFVYKFQI